MGNAATAVRDLATGDIRLGDHAVDTAGDLERAIELAAEAVGVPGPSEPVRLWGLAPKLCRRGITSWSNRVS